MELSQEVRQRFVNEIESDTDFVEACGLVGRNSKGRVWLVGGGVYRTLSSILWQTPKKEIDMDFIVEEISSSFVLPPEWEARTNNYGNPRFVNQQREREIDVVPIRDVIFIQQNKLDPTIENYVRSVSLTIQSIAYDILRRQIIGQVGIEALLTKTVGVHRNGPEHKRKGMSIEQYQKYIADSIDFQIV